MAVHGCAQKRRNFINRKLKQNAQRYRRGLEPCEFKYVGPMHSESCTLVFREVIGGYDIPPRRRERPRHQQHHRRGGASARRHSGQPSACGQFADQAGYFPGGAPVFGKCPKPPSSRGDYQADLACAAALGGPVPQSFMMPRNIFHSMYAIHNMLDSERDDVTTADRKGQGRVEHVQPALSITAVRTPGVRLRSRFRIANSV